MDDGLAGLGVDFGTSHTVAVVRYRSGRIEPLLFDASPLLPSAVFAEAGGELLTGGDAARGARLDPARFEPNPKRRIDDSGLLLGPHEVPVVDAVAAVLRRAAGAAERALGCPPDHAVLTHPAGWAATRCDVLRRAAARASLPQVRLVPEPVAAATYFTRVLGKDVPAGTALVVYDFGAGTFDVSVLSRHDEGGWEVLAAAGLDDVGGLDLDSAIVDWLGREVGAGNSTAWHRLTHPGGADDHRHRRRLWDDVRATKEQLTRGSLAGIAVPILDTEVHLTREEFDELARPWLERTVALTMTTMFKCGMTPDRVAGVFLVGGSSRIPQVATLLHRALGFAPTVIEQPELVVAYGSLSTTAPTAAAAPVAVDEPTLVTEPVTLSSPAAFAEDITPHSIFAQPYTAPVVPVAPAAPPATQPPPPSAAPAPAPPPPDYRRVARLAAVLGAIALVAAVAAVSQVRTGLMAGARAPVAPGGLFPLLAAGLLLVLTGTPGERPRLGRTLGLATLAAVGAALPFTLVALAARIAGHRFSLLYAPETAPVLPLFRLAVPFLWLGLVCGVAVIALGLWLLAKGRVPDPVNRPRIRVAVPGWTLAGVALGALSLTLMYGDQMYFLGGWHWVQDDDTAIVPYLLDEVFWAPPGRGALAWLGFVAGLAATIGVTVLAGVGARTLADRAAPPVRTVAWQSGTVLLVLGGGLATAHTWTEQRYWSTIAVMDDPTTGLLPAVHDAWEATVGRVSPAVHLVAVALAGAVLLVTLALRPSRATRS